MQKHGKTAALVVVALVGIAALAILSRHVNSSAPREPRYKGMILSEWLCPSKKPETWGMGAWEPHREAILHIGTNAIPFAIRWMQYREPTGQFNPRMDKNYMLAIASVDVFEVLGTKASGAISELTQLLNSTNQSELTPWVVLPAVFPTLVQMHIRLSSRL